MVDSRSSSLSRGMRNHPPVPEGEEMSEVLSGSCHGEGEGPIPGEKREGGVRRVRESPGFPRGKALQGPSEAGEGVRQEVEGEEAAEGSEVRQLRDLRRSASERMGMSSTVVPARWIGMEHGITGDVWLGERREDFARNAGRFQQGRIGFVAKNVRRRISVLSSGPTTNGRGKDYAFNAERSRRERL